ncbi:hypothetical protein K2Q08_00420, partial [Patescibacteria group bacterium]|nr:hypothetical protein [Patescibacteria group bacterium]
RPRPPEKPPLGGATSLKEALAMASRAAAESKHNPDVIEKEAKPAEPAPTNPTPSLKEALGKIVSEKNTHNSLPEETLRDMLRVDVSGNETE